MRSDLALYAAVRTALWAVLGPISSRIGITVANGVVTLSGDVDLPDERVSAARAVRRIADVRAVADGIRVAPPKEMRIPQCPKSNC